MSISHLFFPALSLGWVALVILSILSSFCSLSRAEVACAAWFLSADPPPLERKE